jgi:hypothetical protein
MTILEIGRLLRANTARCVVGCQVSQLAAPAFGGLVRIPVSPDYQIFGLIHDIHIDDDGIVRQLVTAGNISEEVLLDNRNNRNVPIEISVLFVGYLSGSKISHMLPPRPPLSLDSIYPCSPQEICQFTSAGRFGWFRHIIRAEDLPTAELLAAHLLEAHHAQVAEGRADWIFQATTEVITLLRDDYPTLGSVLGSLAELGIYTRDIPAFGSGGK